MKRLPLLLLAILFAGCGGSGSGAKESSLPSSLQKLFRYDRSAPLDVKNARAPVTEQNVTLSDISFSSAGRRVQAFVLAPSKKGKHPAVIYQHGSGQNRAEFVPEAFKLARRGVVSVLLDEPWVRGGPTGPRNQVALTVRNNYVDNVIDVRRAVDYLLSRGDVARHRIGFLGHSYGAAIGGIASGVEKRIVAYDLLAVGATPSAGYARIIAQSPQQRAAYKRLLHTIDPIRYVRHANPSKLFLQAGRDDELIPQPDLKAMINAASKPKKIKWYDAGHALTQGAFDDSAAWLARELKFA